MIILFALWKNGRRVSLLLLFVENTLSNARINFFSCIFRTQLDVIDIHLILWYGILSRNVYSKFRDEYMRNLMMYICILPIRLQIANQNCTQMLLDLDVYYFPQMCQFVLVKDYNKENNAQITKCI